MTAEAHERSALTEKPECVDPQGPTDRLQSVDEWRGWSERRMARATGQCHRAARRPGRDSFVHRVMLTADEGSDATVGASR
jgi:hypothetical protein